MATQVLMSLEEYYALPEKKGIEYQLLRGRLIEMSFPNLEHGETQANLSRLLTNHVIDAGLDYIVASHTGFLLSPETEIGPDVCLIRRDKARAMEVVRRAPDLVIEIASPHESAVDLDEKVAEYLAAGTQIVWVVYGKTRHVMAHYRNGAVQLFAADQTLDAGDLLPGFRVQVKDIFPAPSPTS
jgi:Uma2 family endonuclease